MAIRMVPQTTSAAQWASAETHLEMRSEWRTVRIDGVRYAVVASGTSGRVHFVRADAQGCDCRWYQRTLNQCSHMLAVELAALVDELTEGAAAEPAPTPRKTYRELVPGCRRCGDLAEGKGGLCYECGSKEAFELDRAAKAALVARFSPAGATALTRTA